MFDSLGVRENKGAINLNTELQRQKLDQINLMKET